jgi:hypothetical protein
VSRFTADVYQNEFLPVDGDEVHAIITVASSGAAGAGPSAQAAEIIIIDSSGSMAVPATRIRAAQEATEVAIDAIRDGVLFAVIAGNHQAQQIYPQDGGLAPASENSRAEAATKVRRLRAYGGTAMGTWLTLARQLFESAPDHICHAILLTDGENEHETREQLDATLTQCEGRFQCDCRGVGTDWKVDELRRIASALLGTADIIAKPEAMPADFRAMIESAMGKATPPISLRVWTPRGAEVAFVKQVAPAIEDLTDRGKVVNDLTVDYPTGSWGEESRDYHLCVRVTPREVGDEMLAARVSLVEGDEVLSQGLMRAVWTDDERLSTRINREVAHYTGQAELAECIQEGLEARSAGKTGEATVMLGRAVALAEASGNDGALKLLESVVEVEDAAGGTVRLRNDVDAADEMALDTRSTRTVRLGGGT